MRWRERPLMFFFQLIMLGLVAVLLLWLFAVSYYADSFPAWTGFGPLTEEVPDNAILLYVPAKTLWDWLDLLLLPLFSGLFLTLLVKRADYNHERTLEMRRIEENRVLEEMRIRETRISESEDLQDTSVREYISQIMELLLSRGLRSSLEGDEVRSVARAQTLMVLREVDGRHKARIIHFLYESRLIGSFDGKGYFDSIVELAGASLIGADLKGMNLRGADLKGVNLRGANLAEVDLTGVDFRDSEGVSLDMILKSKSFYGAVLPRTISKSNLQDEPLFLKNI